jgi:hypothetical protein
LPSAQRAPKPGLGDGGWRLSRQLGSPSVAEQLSRRGERIGALVDELLEHSTLQQWNHPGSGIASFSGNHAWRTSEEGRRVRSRLLEEYRRFAATVRVLLAEQPPSALKQCEKADSTLTKICEPSGSTWRKTTAEARAAAAKALARQLQLLNDLYDATEGTPVFAPDTHGDSGNASRAPATRTTSLPRPPGSTSDSGNRASLRPRRISSISACRAIDSSQATGDPPREPRRARVAR